MKPSAIACAVQDMGLRRARVRAQKVYGSPLVEVMIFSPSRPFSEMSREQLLSFIKSLVRDEFGRSAALSVYRVVTSIAR